MRGQQKGGSYRAPHSQTQNTIDSWGRIQRRRRHHFRQETHRCNYDDSQKDERRTKDLEHYGDAPTTINTNKTLRVIGGNIKGLNFTGVSAKISTVASRLKHLQTGHLALQETNTEWNKATLRTAHDNYYKKEFKTANFQYSTFQDTFESNYRPGGTASGALGLWVHRVIRREVDPTGCGRWTSITYGGKEQKKLTIVSVYRVGSDKRHGSTTARKQQHTVMYKDKELAPFYIEPHKQTLIDLQYYIETLLENGHEVLISIDANQSETEQHQQQAHEAEGKTDKGFNYNGKINGSLATFIQNTGLINITTNKHGNTVPNTHFKGTVQIDFLLATQKVVDSTEATGLLDKSLLDSDHCALYCDLNIEEILGFDEDEVATEAFRQLRIDDPRISAAYRKELHRQFIHHGIYRKVKNLQNNSKKEWNLIDEATYEKTDQIIGESMVCAARACTNKTRKAPWTKSVSQATHSIRYWGARITRKGARPVEDGVLDYFRDNSGELVGDLDRDLNIESCIKEGNNARQRLKELVKESKKNSKNFEEELAAARVERRYPHLTCDNEEFAQIREDKILSELKNMGNRLAKQRISRRLAREIKENVKPQSTTKASLNHVHIPAGSRPDSWERITGKEALEAHLKERNVKQFSAAGKTPFGYSDLGKELGHTGDSTMAEEILQGTLEHRALDDKAIQTIVNQLRAHPTIKKILHPVVTTEDFKEALRLVPDKTASSYSGRGVPHYKACAEKTDDPLADVLAAVHAAMMTIPLETGYCPSRWKHVIDIMLSKITGIVRTDKLRIIQLLEADLNQVLRIAFARNIGRLAKENEGIISEHQYGKANSSCMTPVINKLLTIHLLLQKKTEGIVFDNDAKGCYDNIISGISLATLRRIGFSKASVHLLGTLWAQLEHHVATGYGVSETTYRSTAEKLLYGIGQGSCASPILWALLNQLLMTALGDKFDCIILHSVTKKNNSKRPGDSFVDDTTTGVTNDDSNLQPTSCAVKELTETEENMVELMEKIMQFFLDILQVTGGDLAFAKCVWFLICFRWRHGKARLLRYQESHRKITLTSKITNQTAGIKRKEPTESHTTLGFNIMGNGEGTAQREHMKSKASKYSTAIKASKIWKSEAWVAYNTLYLPSVGYGTAATTLSEKECEDIQRPVVNAILPKMGIARSAPRAAIFGTTQYGGMGLAHLAAVQGHSRIQYFMGHLRKNDETGRLIRTSLEYVKLECGCSGNPLTKDYREYGKALINKNWITEIWKHLSEIGATVEIADLWEPEIGRKGDVPLMENIYGNKNFTAAEAIEANTCRIYMQAFFVSDIADIAGTTISREANSGKRRAARTTNLAWPVQQRPTRWGAWKKLLKTISIDGILDTALGNINKNGHQQYNEVINDNNKMLYIYHNDKWTKHRKIGKKKRYEINGQRSEAPREFTHVATIVKRCSYFENTSQFHAADNEPARPTSTHDTIQDNTDLPKHIQRLKGNETRLKETDSEVIMASDGSVVFGVGYHSWIIANKEGEPCIEGGGPDDGDPLLMTSFRSELGGVAGGLASIGKENRQGRTITKATIICDNQSSLKRCRRGETNSIFDATEGDYDLTATIDWLIKIWCKDIEIKFQWVKGHADDLDRATTMEEDLNIMADAKCDQIRANATDSTKATSRCETWSSETCSLNINGIKITSKWKERMTQQLLDGKLRNFLMEKEKWSKEDFEDICWSEQQRATKRISTTRRTAVAKICHNLCYTGAKGKLWKGEDDSCKCCKEPKEDWRHVMTCKSIDAELFRADSWIKTKKTMEKWKMPRDVWTAMEKGIRQYTTDPTHRHDQQQQRQELPFGPNSNTNRTWIRKASKLQGAIGWENFMKGRISKTWTTTMKTHYESNNIKLSATEWTVKMILALWDHVQRIWKFRNDTVHASSSETTKQYKLDEVERKINKIQKDIKNVQNRPTEEQQRHFKMKIDKLQYECRRCWANIAEMYITEINSRRNENLALHAYLTERGGVG